MRVLIVEDEPAIAQDIEEIALAEGFAIAGLAGNAREAMELAPETDIAILDVRLADGLTGPEIAKELINGFGIGVVYLTGNPDLVAGKDGVDVVTKPLNPKKVIDGLRLAAAWRNERMRRPVSASFAEKNAKH
jgi:DNA-binding response OmpR family regulator